jgi:hypothetical protein
MQPHQRRLLTCVVAVTALYAQYAILLTARRSDDEEEAHRNELEVSALVDYTFSC